MKEVVRTGEIVTTPLKLEVLHSQCFLSKGRKSIITKMEIATFQSVDLCCRQGLER